MKLPIYQVDAFADRPFVGNPAAVCPLEEWLPDELLLAIAMENNLSETAFFVPEGEGYRLRWFTPGAEVKLCGHATLASAKVLFDELGARGDQLLFHSLSGSLRVNRDGDLLTLDFPAQPMEACEPPVGLADALGRPPEATLAGEDLVAVFATQSDIEALAPDIRALKTLPYRGLIVTAPGEEHDFVSRFFAPAVGVDEDPVTGSAHTKLAPYWAGRLGKSRLAARQLSVRGGEVVCKLSADRVFLSGRAQLVLRGELLLDLSP